MFYRRNGFLVFPECFSSEEVDILLNEVPRIFAEDTPRRILEKSGAVRTVFAPHRDNEAFRCLSRLPRLVDPARQLLESEVYIHQFKINAKVALEGEPWEWHQDFLYWHKEDAMSAPRVLTAALFLQDVNEFNGPMLVIPGSHTGGMVNVETHGRFTSPQGNGNAGWNGDDHEESPVWMHTLTADLKYKINRDILASLTKTNEIHASKGRAGFVLFFDGNLFHASATNFSPRDRISVFISYNSVENKLRDIAAPRPDFIASRDFSPVVPVDDNALLTLGVAV